MSLLELSIRMSFLKLKKKAIKLNDLNKYYSKVGYSKMLSNVLLGKVLINKKFILKQITLKGIIVLRDFKTSNDN